MKMPLRSVLLVASLCMGTCALAQDVNEIKYKVDSVRYNGVAVPVRRSEDGELNKYIAMGGKNFDVARPLMVLEDGLTNARAYMEAGTRKIVWLPGLHEQIAKIKKVMPKFDLAAYEQELKLYETYNTNFANRLKTQQANIDSVRQAAERQRAIENDRRIAEEIMRKKQKARNTDSIKRAYDSLMVIAAKNEALADRNYNIKKYGPEYGPLISAGQVRVGMTQEMCVAALGEPLKKEKGSEEGVEIWKYRGYGLKFKAGKLIGEDK